MKRWFVQSALAARTQSLCLQAYCLLLGNQIRLPHLSPAGIEPFKSLCFACARCYQWSLSLDYRSCKLMISNEKLAEAVGARLDPVIHSSIIIPHPDDYLKRS